MPRFNHIQHNFIAGEISEKQLGRTDLTLYRDGAQKLENMIVNREGGVSKRPGTKFLASTFKMYKVDSSTGAETLLGTQAADTDNIRMIPFFADENALGNLIIGVMNNGDRYFAFSEIDGSVVDITIDFDGSGSYNTFTGYEASELETIQYAQSGNILILTCGTKPPVTFRITYDGSDIVVEGWSLTNAQAIDVDIFDSLPGGWGGATGLANPDYSAMIPFEDHNGLPGLEITTDLGSNNYEFECASTIRADWCNQSGVPSTTNSRLGQLFKWTDDNATGDDKDKVFHIYAIVDFETFRATLVQGNTTFSGSLPYLPDNFARQRWSYKDGWPTSITFHEQRVIYGGTTLFPETVWASQKGDIYEMDEYLQFVDANTTNASDPFELTMVADDGISLIRWLSSGKILNVGARNREFNAFSSTGLSAEDLNFTSESSAGSKLMMARRDANKLHFVDRSGQKLRRFIYNRDEDAFRAEEVSYNNTEIVRKKTNETVSGTATRPEYIDMHYQNDSSIMWMLTNFGKLIGWTLSNEFKIEAGHFHEIGGTDSSIVTISMVDDYLYMISKRTVNSATVYHYERMQKDFIVDNIKASNDSTSIEDKMVYCDSARLDRLGSPAKIFTGFNHLEGETVDVVGDGHYLGQYVVGANGNAGEIELTNESVDYTEIVAGLNYRALVQSVPVENGAAVGSAQGSVKKLDRLVMRFYRTVGAKYGAVESDLLEVEFRDPEVAMDDPTPLFTGDKTEDFPDDLDRRGEYVIVQDLPLPFHLVCTIIRGVTYD